MLSGLHSVTIDGDFADWAGVDVEYRDTIGDTIHRDYPGYGGLHYQDDSGRNDIVTCKVAVDDENVYFYAETNEPLTPHTGKNWMLLLIDADRNHNTGWYGYDYLVNKKIVDGQHHDADAVRSDIPGQSVGRTGAVALPLRGQQAGTRHTSRAPRLAGRRASASIFTGATIRPT